MNKLIETLDLYFGKKAPQLPTSVKNVIVKIAPYLVVLGIIVSIPGILMMFGLTSMFPAIPYGGVYGTQASNNLTILVALSIVTAILHIISLPGLFKPSPKGWNFSFYAVLVSALQSLFMLNILSLIIGLLISFYILFQVRSYYFTGTTQ